MIVEVTLEDIKEATRLLQRGEHRAKVCPVARALSRVRRLPVTVVSRHWCSIGGKVALFSRRTSTWINKFDTGEPVKPFRFRSPL